MTDAAEHLRHRLNGLAPRVAVVLGSGLGSLVDEVEHAVRIPYSELDGFPHSGVSGHAGAIVAGYFASQPVLFLAGRAHYYELGDAAAMRPVLETLAALRITHLILTNAAGSLHPDMTPGSVMLISDHINFSGLNPLIGEATDRRFVGLTAAYDRDMCEKLRLAAEGAAIELYHGVYMWFSGPSFETPAEIRMARTLGADAVGMSTVPEVILARFMGLQVAACSVITNLAAGLTQAELSHGETKEMAPLGGAKLAAILRRLFADGGFD
jgi:purine-nucleoside phosphorylase